jgi:hypothetical protein
MGIVFLVGGLFHLLKFNWKVFMSYLRRRGSVSRRIGETVVSLSIFFIFLLGSIAAIPPFSSVMEFSESIKNSWEPETNFAPSPHMELQSLEEVAGNLGMSTDKAVAVLSEEGVEVQAVQDVLKKIAAGNRTSPQRLYMILDKAAKPGRGTHGSSGEIQIPGLGRMTVVDVVSRLGLELDQALEKLNGRGVEAEAAARIRDLAQEHNLSPHELVKLMLE